MNLHTAWLVVALSLILLGACKEKETVVEVPEPENLIDPAVIPRVNATYPPDKGTGPFNVFTPSFYGCSFECNPCDCVRPPHFFLEFNKLMIAGTFTSSSIRCVGFDRPVLVNPVQSNQYPPAPSNVIQFAITDSVSIFLGTTLLPYQVGKSYTITVDTTVSDINGNHPEAPFSFSFTPEPYFRVLRSSPAEGESISVYTWPRVQFNSPIDTNIFRYLHLSPQAAGKWGAYQGDSLSAYFDPTSPFQENSSYTLTIEQSAHDVAGHSLKQSQSLVFRTYPFRVDYTNPKDGDTMQYLSNGINITMTGPVDPVSVYQAVSVSPTFDGFFTGYYNDIGIYSQYHDLTPNTVYTVRIDTTLRSLDGSHLRSPYRFSFTTPPFQITNISPGGGEIYVDRATRISVWCNGRIDTSSVRQAFSLLPAVIGHFDMTYYNGTNNFYFSPDTMYLPLTTYHISVSTALKSIDGFHVAQPDTTSFTTVQ